jgi:hypothetical protein
MASRAAKSSRVSWNDVLRSSSRRFAAARGLAGAYLGNRVYEMVESRTAPLFLRLLILVAGFENGSSWFSTWVRKL